MLDIANRMPKRIGLAVAGRNEDLKPVEYKALQQDRCGIICHVILKKEITKTVEEMIEYVEE